MAWDIGLTKISDDRFAKVRSRLLLSYMGVMTTILVSGGAAVYHWVAYDLSQQLNDYLLTLAEAASQTLEIVKHEYYEYEEGYDEDDEEFEGVPRLSGRKEQEGYSEDDDPLETDQKLSDLEEQKGSSKDEDEGEGAPKLEELMRHYGNYKVISVPKHHPLYYAQGVEWFDEKQHLMIREGNLFPTWALSGNITRSQQQHILQKDKIRSVVLQVEYLPPGSQVEEILGYIRASHSIESLEEQLQKLRWGLALGGTVALILTGVGGMLLTRESLKPIKNSFEQLKKFTADASHELRSPITAIKSSVSVLQNHPERIHPADVKKVAAIASATDQMTRLVEDLLLLARMGGTVETITLDKRPVPIDEILEDLLDRGQEEAAAKHIALESQLLAEVWVLADSQQLVRLFSNLIENALQYTPEKGMVKVSLSQSRDWAIVTVADTGIGIAPQDLPHVFDRLWRAEGARACRQDGTGLGMAIAQTIARGHGGQITVTSELGVGTIFQVHLPLCL